MQNGTEKSSLSSLASAVAPEEQSTIVKYFNKAGFLSVP